MLRRAENVRIYFAPSMVGSMGHITVDVGRQSYRLPVKIHKDNLGYGRKR